MTMPELLSEQVALKIRSDFGTNTPLDGERILAERYNCTRSTIRSALKHLSRESMITSIPRRGHYLTNCKSDEVVDYEKSTPAECEIKRFNIILLVSKYELTDQANMEMLYGAFSQANMESASLNLIEIDATYDNVDSFQSLHPGINADGYIIVDKAPTRLHRLIMKSMKPCILLGSLRGKIPNSGERYMRLACPLGPISYQVAEHLVKLGHKKILLVEPRNIPENTPIRDAFEDALKRGGLSRECVDVVGLDDFDPSLNLCLYAEPYAKYVMEQLKDHTAIVCTSGNRLGLELWKRLQKCGRRIPEDLSVVIFSAQQDIFVEIYDIGTVRQDRRKHGIEAVKEVVRQISTGKFEWGVKYMDMQYLPRSTVAKAPK